MRPCNLLVLMSDEHNPKFLRCAGHPFIQTPSLDALAARGTRFTSAYTACPICVPARASFATGRYVNDIGYWDNGDPYDGAVPSWHHELREAGHRGYMIGIDLPEYVTQREAVQRLVGAFVESGGRYYDAKSGATLDDAYRDISAVETDPLRLRTRTEEEPIFQYAAIGCMALLALALALRVLPPFTSLT